MIVLRTHHLIAIAALVAGSADARGVGSTPQVENHAGTTTVGIPVNVVSLSSPKG